MLIRHTLERASRHRALEQALFEVTGRWALAAGDPDTARVLAAQSHHHAWRASMWDGVVPVLHDVAAPPAEPTGDDAELVASLSARRLPDLHAVLEVLLAGYEADLAAAGEVADAPVARVLRLVLLDVRGDLEALGRLPRR